MSSTILKIIPTDATYLPDKAKQDEAKDFLSKAYRSGKINFINYDRIEFVDQGENFESVSCNLCGQNLEIEKWHEAMNKAYESQFSNLRFIVPCCNENISLNDLTYYLPAGFAKFIISISDPQKNVEEKDLNELSGLLQTPLKIIWAHY